MDYDVNDPAFTVEHDEFALHHLVNLSPSMWDRFEVKSEVRGFCCDSGHYSREDSTDTLAELFWHVALFRNRDFRFEYIQAEGSPEGTIDWGYPVYFLILDTDCGEYTNYIHQISKKA